MLSGRSLFVSVAGTALVLATHILIFLQSRRQYVDAIKLPIHRRSLISGVGINIACWQVACPPSPAVQGAAEYDIEYMIRDILGGNPKEGIVKPSSAPAVSPPRTLQGPLLDVLLDDPLSSSAPILSLQGTLQSVNLQSKVRYYRMKTSQSFSSRYQWLHESVADQYYFDLTAYALWRSAADLLPDYLERDKFARSVGRRVYEYAVQKGSLVRACANKAAPLTSTIPSVYAVLDLFNATRFCSSFAIGDVPQPDIFDELDDADVINGGSVNCIVRLLEPATLRASLQITGEKSRFAPEFVGATLAAMWEDAGVFSLYETYFVDSSYRPNPKDYFPNEQWIQFTLSRAL